MTGESESGLSPRLRQRIAEIESRLTEIRDRYSLSASTPLQMLPEARSKITDRTDYVRFLEMSLELRLITESDAPPASA